MASRSAILASVYSDVPTMECKGLCGDYCCVVPMSPLELFRLTGGVTLPLREDDPLRCPLHTDDGCSRYDDRPLICRLWGAVDDLPCPHGCKPERLLTKAEAHALIHRITDLRPTVMIVGQDDLLAAVQAVEGKTI